MADTGGLQQSPGGQPSYAPPPSGTRETEGTAIAALVLAIVSFVVLPLVPAIVALFLCRTASRKIRGSGGTLGGQGLVTAARVVAWVNVGLSVLALIGLIVAIVAFSTLEFT
ncbi:MAG: hypothetical protein ACRDIF_00070 [Actinomycetota bacterium]